MAAAKTLPVHMAAAKTLPPLVKKLYERHIYTPMNTSEKEEIDLVTTLHRGHTSKSIEQIFANSGLELLFCQACITEQKGKVKLLNVNQFINY